MKHNDRQQQVCGAGRSRQPQRRIRSSKPPLPHSSSASCSSSACPLGSWGSLRLHCLPKLVTGTYSPAPTSATSCLNTGSICRQQQQQQAAVRRRCAEKAKCACKMLGVPASMHLQLQLPRRDITTPCISSQHCSSSSRPNYCLLTASKLGSAASPGLCACSCGSCSANALGCTTCCRPMARAASACQARW